MYQKITLIGNLGRDPEMRYLGDGRAVTNFSLATSRKWTDKSSNERQEETAWFRISVWGDQAEVVNQYLSKGRQVMVEGRLQPDVNGNPRLWTRQDGTVAASFEVRASVVRFLGSRGENEVYQSDADEVEPALELEEVPF